MSSSLGLMANIAILLLIAASGAFIADAAHAVQPIFLPSSQKFKGVHYMRNNYFDSPDRVAQLQNDHLNGINKESGCGHSVCVSGFKLAASCDACTTTIASMDPYCTNTHWDATCVALVQNECEVTCEPKTTVTTNGRLVRRGGGGTTTKTTTLPAHTTPANGLRYYGGPIINNVEVTILAWGSAPNYLPNLQTFYGAITASPWFNVFRQYWTSSTNTIGSGSYRATIFLNNALPGFPTKTTLDDANDIQAFLFMLVARGYLKPNKNSYYAIHFPSGYTINHNGQKSCSNFCAYHSTLDISIFGLGVTYMYYGIIPDQGGACAGVCGSNWQTVNNLFAVASHELAETVTDPAVGVAIIGSPPLAWYNSAAGEVADLCDHQLGTTVGRDGVTYVIQKVYSNLDASCVQSSVLSP